uniref:Uncharacterized protein n=1 Tax=Oryza brachyantha TaxID=4533 RepID=J3M393_ORYBR
MSPPLHPLFPSVLQSISSCSDSDVRFPVTIALIPSTAATVENAQQLPHCPWFFTSVTAPFFLQSISLGTSPSASLYLNSLTLPVFLAGAGVRPRYAALNSSCVRSANSLRPSQ